MNSSIAIKSVGRALLAWALVTSWLLAVAGIALLLMATPVRPETCLAKPGKDDDDGREWRWRTVDNKRCWYFSRNALSKKQLLWEYDGAEFDAGGVVRERRFYSIEELRR